MMKLYFFLLIICFPACGKAPENTNTAIIETPLIEVELTYNIEPVKDNKLKIIGMTNLPDGTNLNVRVLGDLVKYDSMSDIKVQDGRFQSAEFSLNNKGLPSGEYIVSVIMPLSNRQPTNIQDIIGKNGEKLAGKLVRRYENSGATVLVRKGFQLKPDGKIIDLGGTKKKP
jgi:hypothetical protein